MRSVRPSMMRLLDTVHRWTGGLIGVLLALLGLSGALLSQKKLWVAAPGVNEYRPYTDAELGVLISRLTETGAARPSYVLLAGPEFGVHRVGWAEGSGAYASRNGEIVASWMSTWDRPELWLFDLHHHFFAGETGAVIAGVLALVGLGFIVTGVILWFRTWRKFRFRLWPSRMTPPQIAHHHRDLGIVVAPLLFLSCLTGAMMTLRPVAAVVLNPFSSPSEMIEASKPPERQGGPLAKSLDWTAMIGAAKREFPSAKVRLISLPREDGDLISMRLKQPPEWHPNGRTMAWFDASSGALVETRDALRLPVGLKLYNGVYPLHAGMTGSAVWRFTMTFAGLALTLLGALATWSFWFRRVRRLARRTGAAPPSR
jgi:uncharacterized iron-regulated membrane protein